LLGALLVRAFRRSPVGGEPGPLTREEVLLAAVCVIGNSFVMLAGWLLFTAGWLRVEAEVPALRALAETLVLLGVMDFAMYVTHRIAHVPVAFRYVHGLHHRYDRVRPLTLFVLHPLEVLGFGGLWITVLLCHSFSLVSVLAYLTINTVFGVVGHAGVEPVPKRVRSSLVGGGIGTSSFHARHHANSERNFGFYTTVWDRLFRTFEAT
jgi:sterol desaturase/sphingolipid hydroxylase (fatty acid hydroxylase superfamily)